MMRSFVAILLAMLAGCERSEPTIPTAAASRPRVTVAAPAAQAPLAGLEAADPSGLAQKFERDVNRILDGERGNSDLVILLTTALEQATAEDFTVQPLRRGTKGLELIEIDNGTVIWKDRKLPAAVTKLQIATINRTAGTYGSLCIWSAGIADVEFDAVRSIIYADCAQGAEGVTSWKREVGFTQVAILENKSLTRK